MQKLLLLFSALGLAASSPAQFYPEAKAYWGGVDDNGGPLGFNVAQVMPLLPDTLINGTTYKKIRENNDASGSPEVIRDHYVRSDTNGKGYVYLPDSAAEFLTGDLNAQAGDTVNHVLVSLTNSTSIDYFFRELLVDSVVNVEVLGNVFTRWYINGDDAGGLLLFWQEGMGTISGPMLEMSGQWWYCCVNDTLQYGSAPCPGWITDNVIESQSGSAQELIRGANPSDGLFNFAGEQARTFSVLNTQGQIIFTGRSSAIDLTEHPPGMYSALIDTPQGIRTVRLLVAR